ncbi:unnamed protein product [Albugo candida]|uniref:Uncharacterized protein n=1 Tax=Albugo candida TaxID=65357 RepID=A0A024FW71_9STRA|nr:unnamed protein product [Albugo candida]|eukprot:CCI11403.1 unnamed protein product [Albugo candida]
MGMKLRFNIARSSVHVLLQNSPVRTHSCLTRILTTQTITDLASYTFAHLYCDLITRVVLRAKGARRCNYLFSICDAARRRRCKFYMKPFFTNSSDDDAPIDFRYRIIHFISSRLFILFVNVSSFALAASTLV